MTSAEFLEYFPEFNCESSKRIELLLKSNECLISSSAFGDLFDTALAYFTAHELYVFKKNKGAVIANEKVGDISRAYNVGSDKDAYFKQSQYGLKYLAIKNSIPKSPFVLSDNLNFDCC